MQVMEQIMNIIMNIYIQNRMKVYSIIIHAKQICGIQQIKYAKRPIQPTI